MGNGKVPFQPSQSQTCTDVLHPLDSNSSCKYIPDKLGQDFVSRGCPKGEFSSFMIGHLQGLGEDPYSADRLVDAYLRGCRFTCGSCGSMEVSALHQFMSVLQAQIGGGPHAICPNVPNPLWQDIEYSGFLVWGLGSYGVRESIDSKTSFRIQCKDQVYPSFNAHVVYIWPQINILYVITSGYLVQLFYKIASRLPSRGRQETQQQPCEPEAEIDTNEEATVDANDVENIRLEALVSEMKRKAFEVV